MAMERPRKPLTKAQQRGKRSMTRRAHRQVDRTARAVDKKLVQQREERKVRSSGCAVTALAVGASLVGAAVTWRGWT